MKKLITLSLLPMALLSAADAAIVANQTIGIDFGTAAPAGATTFNQFDAHNNVIADAGTLAFSALGINSGALKDTANADVTGVGFVVTNNTGWATGNANVTTGAEGAGLMTDSSVYSDTIISNNASGHVIAAGAHFLFTFTGLDDSLTYDLTGGFDNNNNNFDATWSVGAQGSFTTDLTASVGYGTITGLTTDGFGNIEIKVQENSLHVVAGALTLTAVPEPSSYALIAGAFALTSIMVRRRRS
ncbi:MULTISPECIES: PEP-CTERM sorting domain-containing protein [unclassified Lentimonas]|uniref:PEP-CTERM sorting domain-containing protein n=1 Tax=unclassified Lentimonas TaxID=2630993 RepID=UPI001389B4E8|nr:MULTISPECIES: PEP-CTERM sorting domain-containing protein [unclassified Lentimonas]